MAGLVQSWWAPCGQEGSAWKAEVETGIWATAALCLKYLGLKRQKRQNKPPGLPSGHFLMDRGAVLGAGGSFPCTGLPGGCFLVPMQYRGVWAPSAVH